jgi:5-methylcytosine-specific restriction endonuclease McrA
MTKKSIKKEKIPKALREQVWLSRMGKVYEAKCPIVWCSNMINVYDFQCGHNTPESRGGKTDLTNLIPVCSRCNMSMSNLYTIDEWNKKSKLPVVEEVHCCSCLM